MKESLLVYLFNYLVYPAGLGLFGHFLGLLVQNIKPAVCDQRNVFFNMKKLRVMKDFIKRYYGRTDMNFYYTLMSLNPLIFFLMVKTEPDNAFLTRKYKGIFST